MMNAVVTLWFSSRHARLVVRRDAVWWTGAVFLDTGGTL